MVLILFITFKDNSFKGKIINVDKLTYAGNLENLQDIEKSMAGRDTFLRKQI